MPNRLFPAALALATTGTFAQASVYVVDDDAGPGVDFTDIASAVNASVNGDVIVVRPGTYGGFVLTRGIQVLGSDGASVIGEIRVQDVPAGPRVAVARLGAHTVVVAQCAATVLLEDLVVRPAGPTAFDSAIDLRQATDVRLRNVDARAPVFSGMQAVRIDSARVEITHSMLVGGRGANNVPFQFDDDVGGDGIRVVGTGAVHVSQSTVLAGRGGDNGGCEFCPGGDGGIGIRLQTGASLLLTGVSANVVRGGEPGYGDTCQSDGAPGEGIAVFFGAQAQVSGATIEGGPGLCFGHAPAIYGPATIPSPADPSLSVTGTTAPGNVVTYTVSGAPGSAARLRLGRQAIVQDLPDAFEDRLTVPLRTFDLGVLPPTGTATFHLTLPTSLPIGFAVIAQASVVQPSGAVALTQSVPITLH